MNLNSGIQCGMCKVERRYERFAFQEDMLACKTKPKHNPYMCF